MLGGFFVWIQATPNEKPTYRKILIQNLNKKFFKLLSPIFLYQYKP